MIGDQARIPFLGVLVDCGLQSIHDIWQFHEKARALELSMNFGDTEMLPWERILFGVGCIPDVRTTVRVPSDLLLDCHNARDAISKIVGKQFVTSILVLKKTLSTHVKNILALDRFAILQLKYLNNNALTAVTEKIHQAVLDLMPSCTHHPTFAEVLPLDSTH